jgi:hypothetical protein
VLFFLNASFAQFIHFYIYELVKPYKTETEPPTVLLAPLLLAKQPEGLRKTKQRGLMFTKSNITVSKMNRRTTEDGRQRAEDRRLVLA